MSSDQDEEESLDQSREILDPKLSDKKNDQQKVTQNVNFLNGKKIREIKFDPYDMTDTNSDPQPRMNIIESARKQIPH